MMTLALGAGLIGVSTNANASPPGLVLDRVQARQMPLSSLRGVIEQSTIHLHGIPVSGAFETAVVDPQGGRRVVAQSTPTKAPQLAPEEATVSEAEARAIALEHGLEGRPTHKAIQGSRLVYRLILEAPVLAWEVDLPLVLSPEPSMKTIWVSAVSGVVLDEVEQVRASKAEVFPYNPAHTPVTIITELSGVHAMGPGEPLVGERVQAFNCTLEAPDNEEDISPWWDEGECYAVHAALSDENGDFLVPIPDVKYPEQNILGDDLYAEVSMYYHAEKFLDHMAGFGIDTFKCDFSSMLSNYRYSKISQTYPDLDYGPLNNAYYTNQCDPEKGPTMIFGQGSGVDFGYDGDVVYHELGHGMVSHLTPAGLSKRRLRSEASLVDAGGLNEAFADYFSLMITGQPELGDYVARFWATYGRAYIRTGENTKTCPANTVGQVHNDGEPFMAALWASRKRIGGEKMDPAFLEMLMRLPPDSDLETAAHTLYEVAEERRGAGEWSEVDIQHLIRAFDGRGLYDCPRLITDPKKVGSGRTMYLRGKAAAVTPFYPGPMQLRHEVPEGSDNIIVRFRLSPRGTSTGNPNTNPVGALVLIKREDSPIEFKFDLTEVESAGDPDEKSDVDEIIQVRGDWDMERTASLVTGSENQLIIRGFHPGEVVWVTLVNVLKSEAVAGSVSVISIDPQLLDHGSFPGAGESGESESESESESDSDSDSPESGDIIESSEPVTACACRATGSAEASLGQAALMLLCTLPLWRRRRRQAWGRQQH